MSLKHSKIDTLSKLCRIRLTEKEKQILEKNIEQILHYLDQVEQVNTEGISACTTVSPTLSNVFAEDQVTQPTNREALLSNCPDQLGGCIRIPPVMHLEE